MKINLKALIIWNLGILGISNLLASSCHAGNSVGGGGSVYLCTAADGTKRALLVDLWEAEHTTFHGKSVQVVYSDEDPEIQFSKAMKKLGAIAPELAATATRIKEKIIPGRKPLRSDEEIPVPADLKISRTPKGCPAAGMMYFDDDTDSLNVDESLYSALQTKTDVAASWAHEAIYKIFRQYQGQEDSKLARRLVGCIFSDSSDCLGAPESMDLEEGQLGYRCESKDLSVTIEPRCGMSIQETCDAGDGSYYHDPKRFPKNGKAIVRIERIRTLNYGYVSPSTEFPDGFVKNVSFAVSMDKPDQVIPFGQVETLSLDAPDFAAASGPLSDYGYVAKAHVVPRLDPRGDFWIETYTTQSPIERGGASGSARVKCVPQWGQARK